MSMAAFSIWIWLCLVGIALELALFVYPVVRIVRRTGHSGWWVLVAAIPGVNVIMLWVFAFVAWPALAPQRSPE